MTRLYQITAPYFVAGLEVTNGVVVKAAPIIAYMMRDRWSEARMLTYVKNKGWTVEEVI